MGENMARPIERRKPCLQKRLDCVMCDSYGKCKALDNTYFMDKKTYKPKRCPFYLTMAMAYEKYDDDTILEEIADYAKKFK
jgi:hypothetical protein